MQSKQKITIYYDCKLANCRGKMKLLELQGHPQKHGALIGTIGQSWKVGPRIHAGFFINFVHWCGSSLSQLPTWDGARLCLVLESCVCCRFTSVGGRVVVVSGIAKSNGPLMRRPHKYSTTWRSSLVSSENTGHAFFDRTHVEVALNVNYVKLAILHYFVTLGSPEAAAWNKNLCLS